MNCMEREILKKIHNLLSDLSYPFAGQEAYVVGGYVRDLLLNRSTNDIDLLVLNNAKEVALVVADQCDGSFVTLDAENQAYRVVFRENVLSVDIVGPKGASLKEDLCKRDFTINSLAIPLSVYLEQGSEASDYLPNISSEMPKGIIDYSNGLQDLINKQLVCTYQDAFVDDPLRILRGVRLSLTLGFTIPSRTKHGMNDNVSGLNNVSFERIREEIWTILDQPRSLEAITFLVHEVPALPLLLDNSLTNGQSTNPFKSDLYSQAIGKGLYALRAWEEFWSFVISANKSSNKSTNKSKNKATNNSINYIARLVDYTSQVVGANKTRGPLLKFAFLIGSLLEVVTQDRQSERMISWVRGWKLSRAEMDILKCWLSKEYSWNRLDLHDLYDTFGIESPGALLMQFFFYRRGDIVGEVSLSEELFSEESMRELQIVIQKIFNYIDTLQRLPQLLTGKELMQLFRMPANKEISKALRTIQKAQLDGIIESREEAISHLRGIQRL